MKIIISMLFLAFAVSGYGYERRPSLPVYTIVSDKIDSTVRVGTCIVEGKIRDQSGHIISSATVSTLDNVKTVKTNLAGEYSLLLSENDSVIYMFHPKYGEIVIQNYNFKSQHRVVIEFNPISPSERNQTVKKPVIYLYSNIEQNVNITLSHPGITFTYPESKNGWNVKTNNNGNVTETGSEKNIPYLFWEATTSNLNYQIENNKLTGFLISTDSLVLFLENSLTSLGLNSKEQTDFITFWAPQLYASPHVLIQFLIDEEYGQKVAPIVVSPQPQNMRRVFMLYTPISDVTEISFDISNQKLPGFNRSGLTLLEWGGAEISLPFTDVN